MEQRRITETEVKTIQEFYDQGNSLKACEAKYGWSRGTMVKYLTTRTPQAGASIENKKRRRVECVVEWRKRTKQKLVDYKGGKCACCGYSNCIEALEFHHRDPSEKELSISGSSRSFEFLKKEADKCVLVCSNCHKEIHAGKRVCPN